MIAYRGPPELTGPLSAGSADEIRRLERSVWSPVPPQTSSSAGPDPGPAPRDITRLLQSYVECRDEALDELMPLVYEDLKQIARNHLRREPDGLTIRTTALVHESYLRMMGSAPASVRDRSHLFAIASRVMRNILVDQALQRLGERDGDRVHAALGYLPPAEYHAGDPEARREECRKKLEEARKRREAINHQRQLDAAG